MLVTRPALFSFALLALVHGVRAQDGPQPPAYYESVVTAHAAIACTAWVFFFPMGAIMIRLLSSPKAWLVHACIMVFGYAMVIASASMGIWMGVVSQQLDRYHPITGLVSLALVSFQPIGGVLHHYLWSKQRKSEIIAMYHIWMGRILITLGMIQGGLGLLFSDNATKGENIAYGVIAGVIWVSWIVIVITVPLKRGKEIPGTINRRKRGFAESTRTVVNDSPESRSEKGSLERPERNGITVNFRQ